VVGLTLILDPRSRAVCFLLLAAFFIQLFRMNIGHLSSDWKPHVRYFSLGALYEPEFLHYICHYIQCFDTAGRHLDLS